MTIVDALTIMFSIITFERTHTIYVVFHSRGFFDVPRVLIADARSFQALAAILDYVTHLDSMSCWHRSDARQNGLLHCEFQKNEVMTMSVVGGQPKKARKYISYKQQNTSSALF